ncbi:MAG: hypothetical protein NVS3B10_00740 [Polyangiales bacterium]
MLDDGARVAVVDPDQGSVSLLDATTLEPMLRIEVGEEPRALLGVAGRLLVTTHRGGQLVTIDPASGKVLSTVSLCAGAWGLAASADERQLAVACEWDETVLRLDRRTLAILQRTPVRRPHAVAFVGDDILAAEHVGGHVVRIHADGSRETRSLVPTEAPYRPALTGMTANLATAIVPAFGAVFVTHLLENHDGDATREPIADDYGSVLDGNPKINPALTTLESARPVLYARFDGGPRVFDGPVAAAPYGDRYLLVAHVSTNDVAMIDTTATTPESRVVGSFAVGAGPHGVAVDEVRRVAFIDNAFDHSVSRIDLAGKAPSTSAPRWNAELTRVRALPATFSPAALAGRKLFYDATNPHVTPSAAVTCATCHPDGGDDGLVWFIRTAKIPLKRRRTPHLANASARTAPYHWDGSLPTRGALTRATMTDLMAGDGLLVDVDSIAAYLDEIVKPPRATPGDPAAIARGQALFAGAAGCGGCHVGDELTDRSLHAVLAPMSLQADDVFPIADTPGLRGVFLRAPYFHDGRAADLDELLTRPDATAHGAAGALSPEARADLVTYLRTL